MDCLISFSDFLYAFQAQFYYEGKNSKLKLLTENIIISIKYHFGKFIHFVTEFLSRCADVYKSIIEEPQTPRETVVVPTSDPTPKPQVTFFMLC